MKNTKKIVLLLICSLAICLNFPVFATLESQSNSPNKPELIDQRLAAAAQAQQQTKVKPTTNNEKSLLYTVLMYLPNRLIDLSDIITMEAGFGPEASFELTLTKYGQLGGSYGDRYFLAKAYNRQYGGGYHSGYNASLLFWNNELCFRNYTFGTVEPYFMLKRESNIASPDVKPYSNNLRDFWRIGLHLGWIIDIGVAIHPVAIANFFTGFFFVRLTDTKEL